MFYKTLDKLNSSILQKAGTRLDDVADYKDEVTNRKRNPLIPSCFLMTRKGRVRKKVGNCRILLGNSRTACRTAGKSRGRFVHGKPLRSDLLIKTKTCKMCFDVHHSG